MYILDTDTLSLLHAGHAQLVRYKDRFDPAAIATTAITRIEMLRGRFDFVLKARDGQELLRALQWLQRTEELLSEITVVSFGDEAVAQFDKFLLNKKLKKIGRADLLIASIAAACRATLVTRNVKDFERVPGLRVENWAG